MRESATLCWEQAIVAHQWRDIVDSDSSRLLVPIAGSMPAPSRPLAQCSSQQLWLIVLQYEVLKVIVTYRIPCDT